MLIDRPACQGMPGLLLFGVPVRVEGLSATLALTSLRIVPDDPSLDPGPCDLQVVDQLRVRLTGQRRDLGGSAVRAVNWGIASYFQIGSPDGSCLARLRRTLALTAGSVRTRTLSL